MPRGRRMGTLSDEQTLALYDGGVHPHDIGQREGITAGAVLARVSAARGARRSRNAERVIASRSDSYGFERLRAAVDRLEAQERELAVR